MKFKRNIYFINSNDMILKKKIYRGTKLSEWLKYLDGNPPKKMSFWITDFNEAKSYAMINKLNDRWYHGAIIEWELEITESNIKNLTNSEYALFQEEKWQWILKNKIGKYDLWLFQIYILPKNIAPKNSQIIKVV